MIPRVRSRMTTTNRIVKVIEHLLSLRAKRRSVNTGHQLRNNQTKGLILAMKYRLAFIALSFIKVAGCYVLENNAVLSFKVFACRQKYH